MKKYLSLMLALLLLLACVPFTGCYRIRAASKQEIAGTYELTSLRRSDKADQPEGNLKELNEVTAYLVVDENGGGYYIYRDRETPLSCRVVETRLTPSAEDPDRYEYVEFRTDTQSDWEKFGYAYRGLNKRAAGGTTGFHIDYYIDTEYRRVDGAQDLSCVQRKLDTTFSPLAFGLGPLQGTVRFSNAESQKADAEALQAVIPYEESVMDIDIPNRRVTHTYRLRADDSLRTEVLSLTLAETEAGYTLTIGQEVYRAQITLLSKYAYLTLRCEKTAVLSDGQPAVPYTVVYSAASNARPALLTENDRSPASPAD